MGTHGVMEMIGVHGHLACVWEATARKVGNVHPGVAFADMSYLDFVHSAGSLAVILSDATVRSIGETIHRAVVLRRQVCAANTNLGIALLLVPLAAWASGEPSLDGAESDKQATHSVLTGLTRQDAMRVYDAIRLASPGGLGDVPEQDVRSEPTVTLLEAMRLAAERDQIARQYATGFTDIFDFGVPAFLDGLARFGSVEAGIIHCQLAWLAKFPDSLIARKCGSTVAADVRDRSAAVVAAGGLATTAGRAAGVALDRQLRSDGNRLNPGTTADLVTACLFVALRRAQVKPTHPFRWDVPDWL